MVVCTREVQGTFCEILQETRSLYFTIKFDYFQQIGFIKQVYTVIQTEYFEYLLFIRINTESLEHQDRQFNTNSVFCFVSGTVWVWHNLKTLLYTEGNEL